MDGTSNAFHHLERAGGINLPAVHNRTGIVKYGWNEDAVRPRSHPQNRQVVVSKSAVGLIGCSSPRHRLQFALPTNLLRFPISMVCAGDASDAICQSRTSFSTLCVVNNGTVNSCCRAVLNMACCCISQWMQRDRYWPSGTGWWHQSAERGQSNRNGQI